jgi:hypothetical protein
MIRHIIHSHIELPMLFLSLGIVIAILAFYWFVGRHKTTRTPAPKFASDLSRRLQAAKRSKKRPPGKEHPV